MNWKSFSSCSRKIDTTIRSFRQFENSLQSSLYNLVTLKVAKIILGVFLTPCPSSIARPSMAAQNLPWGDESKEPPEAQHPDIKLCGYSRTCSIKALVSFDGRLCDGLCNEFIASNFAKGIEEEFGEISPPKTGSGNRGLAAWSRVEKCWLERCLPFTVRLLRQIKI